MAGVFERRHLYSSLNIGLLRVAPVVSRKVTTLVAVTADVSALVPKLVIAMGRTYDHGRAAFRSAATGLMDRVVRVINRFASAYRRVAQGRTCTTVVLFPGSGMRVGG